MVITRRPVAIVSAVVLTVLLSACGVKEATEEATSTTQSGPSATTSVAAVKPNGDKIAPADLPATVANRTYRGESDGKPYAEYYTPDGSVRGKAGGEVYTGSWKVVGEQLCFTYPKPGADNEVDCYSVFKNGDVLAWTDSKGEVVETTFVEGNPDNL